MAVGFEKARPLRRRVVFAAIVILMALSASLLLRAFNSGTGENTLRMVSGTEYISGEVGQVIVRLSDFKGRPITDGLCNATILYPDKSYFMLDQPLQSSTVSGNYFREFTTPELTGIYEETIVCTPAGKPGITTVSSSFHVSVALNFIIEMSRLQAERYYDLVRRINATQNNISAATEDILREINETYSYDLLQRIGQAESSINSNINETRTALNSSTSSGFISINNRMVSLGNAILSIFGG